MHMDDPDTAKVLIDVPEHVSKANYPGNELKEDDPSSPDKNQVQKMRDRARSRSPPQGGDIIAQQNRRKLMLRLKIAAVILVALVCLGVLMSWVFCGISYKRCQLMTGSAAGSEHGGSAQSTMSSAGSGWY